MLTAGGMRPPPEADADLLAFLGFFGRGVETALGAREAVLRELLQARRNFTTALQRAGQASRRCVRAFDDTLLRLRRTRLPGAATDCARELGKWLEAHVEACDHFNRARAPDQPAPRDRRPGRTSRRVIISTAPPSPTTGTTSSMGSVA